MTCGVYSIINKLNKKTYIGQSINIERRFREHKYRYKTRSAIDYEKVLYKAFRKYDLSNFTFEILEECLPIELNAIEMKHIIESNSLVPNGYNVSTDQSFGVIKDYVYEIVDLLKNTDISGVEIGELFILSDQTVSDINTGKTSYIDGIAYPIRKRTVSLKTCTNCGIKISNQNKSSLCIDCLNKSKRKVDRPSKEVLEQDLKETNFTQVGKKYGVSDNAVRRWCKSYGMSTKAKDYKLPR